MRDPNLQVLVGNPWGGAAGRVPPFGMVPYGLGGGCGTSPYPVDPALAQQIRNAQCNMQAAQAERAARSVIASQQPQIPLNFRSDLIAPGSIVTLTATPSVPLCITDCDVSRVCSAFFIFNEMKAVRTSLFADGAGLMADVLSPDAIHPTLEWPFLMPGTPLTIVIENIDAASHRFFCTFWGIESGQPGPCV